VRVLKTLWETYEFPRDAALKLMRLMTQGNGDALPPRDPLPARGELTPEATCRARRGLRLPTRK